MNPAIAEFLEFIENDSPSDYGDFKREVDLHLKHMIESLRPLTQEQVWQLQKLREQLLWSYRGDEDIAEVRQLLKQGVKQLEAFNPPEL